MQNADGENKVVLRGRGTTEWGAVVALYRDVLSLMLEPRPTESERQRIFLGTQDRQQEQHRQKIIANRAFWRNNNEARLAKELHKVENAWR